MKIGGVIAEYNPFHNGHKYQLDKIKAECGGVISVMSGGFVQRGDAACADKRTRARAAVEGGCDLVLELPVCFALNTAQIFSRGAVSLLDKTAVVDRLYFGAECADIEKLKNAAYALENESAEVSLELKRLLADGMSFPKAQAKAYSGLIEEGLLSSPNNILAIEYLRSLISLNSNIEPCVIERKNAAHDSDKAEGVFASASYIRSLISSNEDFSKYVPKNVYDLYSKSDMSYSISNIDSFIIGTLRLMTPDDLTGINDISEGLENRIITAAKTAVSFEELCSAVKTKRYTMSKIRRVILSAVLRMDKVYDISYARVLAMNETGRKILKEMKEKSGLTLITKTALFNSPSLELDIKADNIHSLCSSVKNNRCGNKDFTVSPSIL